MPDKTFTVEIITPERVVFTGEIVSLTVPATEGPLGVLTDHAPLMAELVCGGIWLRHQDGEEMMLCTSGGFMEVRDNHVRILSDSAEMAEEINIARAEEARKRAEERLRKRDADLDIARAEAALKRAISRLRVARR